MKIVKIKLNTAYYDQNGKNLNESEVEACIVGNYAIIESGQTYASFIDGDYTVIGQKEEANENTPDSSNLINLIGARPQEINIKF